MPQVRNSRGYEIFTDGLLSVCETDERRLIRTKIENIRFGNRTVGVSRHYRAKTAGDKVDKLLGIPLEAGVNLIGTNDVVIINKEKGQMGDLTGQYQISQIQPKFDARPPAIYLSLEKIIHPYKDGRITDGN